MQLFINRIVDKINKYSEELGNPYKTFGIFGLITYPLYFVIWKTLDSSGYENLALRMVAALLCIPLIFIDKWPPAVKRFLNVYWYLVLLYCLPFLFTFLLLKNNFSVSWVLNTMTVLVLGVLLLDLAALLVVLGLGIALGVLCYSLFPNTIGLPDNYLIYVVTYLSVLIFGALFARRKAVSQQEKTRIMNMKLISASIAHELRTPLRTISLIASSIKHNISSLAPIFQVAKQQQLSAPEMINAHEEIVADCDGIEAETQRTFTLINMLLMNVNTSINPQEFKVSTIKYCVDEALRRYPFDLEEEELVSCKLDNESDFSFLGNELLVTHIIFNLMKNAFYQIKAAGKGEIHIWTEKSGKNNELHFKDTARGISPKTLPHIFERFFTNTQHGAGIGLAFCKLVMQGFGGDITCCSVEGEFAEFIMSFPKQA